MMTSESDGTNGNTNNEKFKGSDPKIKELCEDLKKLKEKCVVEFIEKIKNLPQSLGKEYQIDFHKPDTPFTDRGREEYFLNLPKHQKQVVFVDPDTGFEPKSCKVSHVKYSEIDKILKQLEDPIVVVFQNSKREVGGFQTHFKEIEKELNSLSICNKATAIYWSNKVMFVAITQDESQLEKIKEANTVYEKAREQVNMISPG